MFYTVPFDITFDMAFSLTSSELRLDATGREAEVRAGWSERALLKRSYIRIAIVRSGSSGGGRPVGRNLPRGDLGGIGSVEPQATEDGGLD